MNIRVCTFLLVLALVFKTSVSADAGDPTPAPTTTPPTTTPAPTTSPPAPTTTAPPPTTSAPATTPAPTTTPATSPNISSTTVTPTVQPADNAKGANHSTTTTTISPTNISSTTNNSNAEGGPSTISASTPGTTETASKGSSANASTTVPVTSSTSSTPSDQSGGTPSTPETSTNTPAATSNGTTSTASPTNSTNVSNLTTSTPSNNGSASGSTATVSTPAASVTPTPAASVTPTPATSAPVTSAPVTSSTSAPVTSAPVTSAPVTSSTSAPVTSNVVISETNLLLASDNLFVELKGTANASLTGLSVVVFNASSAVKVWSITFTNQTLDFNGLFSQSVNKTQVSALTSVLVALYTPGTNIAAVDKLDQGLQDSVVYSVSSASDVSSSIGETMLQTQPLTRVNSSLATSKQLTMSRCGTQLKDSSMFVLTPVSKSQANPCLLNTSSSIWTLQLHNKDRNCQNDDKTLKDKVVNKLVETLNRGSKCGLTTMLIKANLTCSRDLYLEFNVIASYKGQLQHVIKAFTAYVTGTPELTLDSRNYSVVNCTRHCRVSSPHPHGDDKKANASVTVAVVLSCIAVFLIILVSVILYMRSKRRGIIRQFRMTRLQEDDDMEDMDNFIGDAGEPSFSSSRSNLSP